MEEVNLKTIIILVDVDEVTDGRTLLESIEGDIINYIGYTYLSSFIADKMGLLSSAGISCYRITDFMDYFNDDLINQNNLFMGYVYMKNHINQ